MNTKSNVTFKVVSANTISNYHYAGNKILTPNWVDAIKNHLLHTKAKPNFTGLNTNVFLSNAIFSIDNNGEFVENQCTYFEINDKTLAKEIWEINLFNHYGYKLISNINPGIDFVLVKGIDTLEVNECCLLPGWVLPNSVFGEYPHVCFQGDEPIVSVLKTLNVNNKQRNGQPTGRMKNIPNYVYHDPNIWDVYDNPKCTTQNAVWEEQVKEQFINQVQPNMPQSLNITEQLFFKLKGTEEDKQTPETNVYLKGDTVKVNGIKVECGNAVFLISTGDAAIDFSISSDMYLISSTIQRLIVENNNLSNENIIYISDIYYNKHYGNMFVKPQSYNLKNIVNKSFAGKPYLVTVPESDLKITVYAVGDCDIKTFGKNEYQLKHMFDVGGTQALFVTDPKNKNNYLKIHGVCDKAEVFDKLSALTDLEIIGDNHIYDFHNIQFEPNASLSLNNSSLGNKNKNNRSVVKSDTRPGFQNLPDIIIKGDIKLTNIHIVKNK